MSEMTPSTKGPLAAPIYQRIAEDLRAEVRAGRWQAGSALPSRRELARDYGVDVGTLQRAIRGLVADGILEASARRGTTVAASPVFNSSVSPPAPSEGGVPGEAVLGIITSVLPSEFAPDTSDDSWTQAALSALERVFCGAGGATRVFNRWRVAVPAVSFLEAVAALRGQGVDALVVIALQEAPDTLAEALAAVSAEELPIVFLTSDFIDRPIPHVFYDQEAAGYQAAQHLLRRGLHRLVFLAPFTADWVEGRLAGAAKAVRHAGLPPDALQIPRGDRNNHPWEVNQEEAGCQAARAALEAGGVLGAGLIAVNDAVAFGVVRAAREIGLTAGEDFALLGFDDTPQAGLSGLTSLRPPLEALGEEAGRLILHRLRGEKTGLQVRLQSHLIVRASTFAFSVLR